MKSPSLLPQGRGRELRHTHALPRPSACAHALPCVLHNGVLHGGLHNGVLHGGAGLPSCVARVLLLAGFRVV